MHPGTDVPRPVLTTCSKPRNQWVKMPFCSCSRRDSFTNATRILGLEHACWRGMGGSACSGVPKTGCGAAWCKQRKWDFHYRLQWCWG